MSGKDLSQGFGLSGVLIPVEAVSKCIKMCILKIVIVLGKVGLTILLPVKNIFSIYYML
jgi:hypothetical protein